ncbi:50S ribosomal protein L13 [Bifidobacterium lemurum]|uniref:Large ribosomal subunit protein uL13 n=1 Tax=Bifidobacterium lemurum TaxID=1603886 RepID=A0A261FV96_9BIFI|nr:50S ribosomal protein L13 [Bifidobacterium lemurum]
MNRKGTLVKTFTPKPADLTHDWYVVDATDVVLGRLASQVATLLRGKNKPTYAPHADSGNHVIIINADKIALTGNKMGKELYMHSGRPGGLRRDSYAELLAKNPERIIRSAVKGMLPKNRLAKVQLDRLRIFRGAEHPHVAQKPQAFEIAQVSQQAK